MKMTWQDDGWRITDDLWERMAPMLPAAKPHPLKGHRPRIPNRTAMDGILLVLRTGMQWSALDGTGICTGSAAYRRFREWLDAGVFQAFLRSGLLKCDALSRIAWDWLARDERMTAAAWDTGENTAHSDRPRQRWRRAPPVARH